MITKIIKLLVLVSMLVLTVACGQQEDFYSFCKTTEGHLYSKQPAPNTCPFVNDVDVPSSEKVGW